MVPIGFHGAPVRTLLVGLGFLLPAMIVEPDFLEHWKTRLLVRLLGTEVAPIYVIRLWAHCQSRKTDRFTDWNPDVLASVCRWDGDAAVFWNSMLQTFARVEDGAFVAHDWAQCNASLISAWTNGKLGGRPTKKKPTENPPVNRTETDWLSDREDREDRSETKNTPKQSPWVVAFDVELPEGLRTENCLEAVKLWLKYKSERREGYKQTGLKAALTKWSREFTPATFPSAVDHSMASGWSGIFPPKESYQPQPQRHAPDTSKYTPEQIALMEAMG